MRGRFAIPIHDRQGTLMAYCGRAVSKEQQPPLVFPNGFHPESDVAIGEQALAVSYRLLKQAESRLGVSVRWWPPCADGHVREDQVLSDGKLHWDLYRAHVWT